MPNQSTSSSEPSQRHLASLLKMLKTTLTQSSQVTFYAAALGAILLIPGIDLPPALAVIASGVGVNALSSILERIARGEQLPNEQIRTQIQAAIEESRIAEKLNTADTQAMVAKLFRKCDVIKFALDNGEYEILQRLEQQATQYETLLSELRDDISGVQDEIRKLAKQEQQVEIIELEKVQIQKIERIELLLMQFIPFQLNEPMGGQVADSPPSRVQLKLALAKSEAKLNLDPSDCKAWLEQAIIYYKLKREPQRSGSNQ